jgi:hypothetical protein
LALFQTKHNLLIIIAESAQNRKRKLSSSGEYRTWRGPVARRVKKELKAMLILHKNTRNMPTWGATATEAQKSRFRAAISEGQRRAWHPKGHEPALYAQGLPEGCARFYWLARDVFGDHNPTWTAANIIACIK